MSKVTKKPGAVPQGVVINQLQIRSADRSRKDIDTWRNAHKSAESVHFPNRTTLYDVYADVILDGHLSGLIDKRIDAVLNKSLQFEKSDKTVDELEPVIRSKAFRKLVRLIMESRLWGISGLEFLPGKQLNFLPIPRKHIKPDKGIIALEQSGQTGIPYAELPNVLVVTGDEDATDLGLLLKAAPYALYKRGALGDWAQFVEIFGQPVRIVKYDTYDAQTKMELKEILDESGSSLALMIPKQADFEILDGKQTNGDGKLQDTLVSRLNNEMSVIILGNTETTASENGGSNAKSQTHAKQQLEITKSDIAFVLGWLNSEQFLNILASYGLPVAGGEFSFAKDVDVNAVKAQMEVIQMARNSGTPVGDDHVYELTGIPRPDDYEQLKKEQRQQQQGFGASKPGEDSEDLDKDLDALSAKRKDGWAVVKRLENAITQFRLRLGDFFGPAPEQ